MPNTTSQYRNNNAPERDFAQEKALAESLLNQRIGFFLLFFVITLAAAILVKSKMFFLLVLATGTVICWILALAIILTTRAINSITKNVNKNQSNPFSVVSLLSDKISHWMIGYFLPVFCSLILTLTLLAGSFGFIDSYFIVPGDIPSYAANKIENLKNDLRMEGPGRDDKSGNHFKSIDSVVTVDKQTRSDIKLKSQNVEPGKKTDSKSAKEIKKTPAQETPESFKDDVLVPRNNMQRFTSARDTSKFKKAAVGKKKEAAPETDKAAAGQKAPSQYFPSVDTVIAKNNDQKLDKVDKLKEGLIIRDKKPDDKMIKPVKPADTSKAKTK